jgi:transcriptional regulator with XRE-family HTH domain
MLSPDELAIAVDRNVRSLRQERGLGMAELAQRCSTDPCTIRRLETGHSAQLYTLYKVAQALQVEVGDLVNTAPPTPRVRLQRLMQLEPTRCAQVERLFRAVLPLLDVSEN